MLNTARLVATALTLAVLLAIAAIAPAQSPPAESPPVGSTSFDRAVALAKSGKPQDAVAEYDRIIAIPSLALSVKTEARFAKAVLLDKLDARQQSLGEYDAAVKENKQQNAELAAEALFRGGLYSSTMPRGTLVEKSQGMDTAHQWWRQLRDEFPMTNAARKLTEPLSSAPEGRMRELEARIDKRNSADWKYQAIDFMVRMTGKNPTYSYSFALILMAVLVKLILLPLTRKQYGSMREMQRMQPLIKDLQKKFKGADLQQKTMALYKEHGVNPMAGCLPSLLQLPFLLGVFNAIREYEIAFGQGKFLWVGSSLSDNSPQFMNQSVFGRNLASPDIPLLVLYGLTNYITMKMTPATDPQQQQQQNTMAVMTSVLFFWMFLQYKWSSAFVVYWLALNLLSIWQQYEYIYKPHKERLANGTVLGVTTTVTPAPEPPSAKPALSDSQPPRVRPRKKRK